MFEILVFAWKIFFWFVIGFGGLVVISTVMNFIQYRTNIFNNFYNPIEQDPSASRKLELIMGKFAANELTVVERDKHFTIFRDNVNNRNIKVVTRIKSYFYGCIIEKDIIPYVRPENKVAKDFYKFMKNIHETEIANVNEVLIE